MVEFSLPAKPVSATTGAARKRKAHSKSRQGCGNCKLRRIKCDEEKPSCQKCLGYGVLCSYNRMTPPDMRLSFGEEASLIVETPPLPPPVSINNAMLGMMNHHLNSNMDVRIHPIRQLNHYDLGTVGRFLARTLESVGIGPVRDAYRREGFRLACTYPFVMHTILAVTLAHDRHLAEGPFPRPSAVELKHSVAASELLRQKLREQLSSDEKDAVWVTGAFLGLYSVASFDGGRPQDAWPLRRPAVGEDDAEYEASSLRWLRLSEGKREILRIADPARPDSKLQDVTKIYDLEFFQRTTDREIIDQLPRELVEFLGIGAGAIPGEGPYWQPAAIVSRLWRVPCNLDTVGKNLVFLAQIEPEFISLLGQKDPGAMIILACWLAKISTFPEWWIFRRAWFEAQAICIYLRQHYSGVLPDLDKLLQYPESLIGELQM